MENNFMIMGGAKVNYDCEINIYTLYKIDKQEGLTM